MAALTATAQSALHPGPSWDETIVPTLRKRLEDESRMLSNRLSQASLGDDGYAPNYYQFSPQTTSTPLRSPSISERPSAIPRPSLSQARPSDVRAQSPPSHFKRARTKSTPQVYDGLPSRSSPSPEMPPTVNGRPTRIPVSPRARSPSASSHFSSNLSDPSASPTTPKPKQNGYAMPPVNEASRSSVNISKQPSPNASGIMNEEPPFVGEQSSLRSSMDSEEHPYEHWYRGDYSRNGGVGELRVGRRQEMLEIASYGHSLRKMPSKSEGRTSRADTEATAGRRRRAESFGARGSLYFGEEAAGMVLDEPPLTDFEDEDEMSAEGGISMNSRAGVSSPSLLSEERTSAKPITSTPSRIPARRTPPVNGTRSASGSSSTTQLNGPKPRAPHLPTPPSTRPRVHSAAASTKRRAKSPAVSAPPSSAKKAKQVKTAPRTLREEESRRSIAEYPIPKDGDADMSYAIPVWTQPKAKGNWDEVVLPVVARKKGLHGLYEEADGNTPQKKPEEAEPAPAPGTFGFDYSKYKPPRTDLTGDDIPMDEFGRSYREDQEDQSEWHGEPESGPAMSQIDVNEEMERERERARMRLNPQRAAESPVPFARYHSPNEQETMSANGHPPQAQPQVEMQVFAEQEKRRRQQEEEEEAGGCCKCVIM
ncbi:hypothetical protein OE88DRAFT_1737506 [Heliocybe sulcata]|uniref:Uncharacterized protein n=1 Tax=Heliocybe sulcata TaxID=5364 RepID=A0A5C3MV88_9AGAM|nr:hypothetical protein OE88DRAFT_1737506 [Heliocybe sulcata]